MGYKKDILSNLLHVFEPSHYFYYLKYIKGGVSSCQLSVLPLLNLAVQF